VDQKFPWQNKGPTGKQHPDMWTQ